MKVFVTGATGYCGAELVRLLLAEGHQVTGLVRSEPSAERLTKAGGQAVRGALGDLDILAKAAAAADGVVHTAFQHDGSVSYDEAINIDCAAIKAMTDAMAGTNKPFVMSSATSVYGNFSPAPATEELPIDPDHPLALRAKTERVAILAAGKGVRSAVLRMPPFIWGGNGSVFIPLNIKAARLHGKAHYILPGTQQTSGTNVEDMARLYVLAMKHATAGTVFNATSSHTISAKSMAEAVGKNVGVPAEGISLQDAVAKDIWPEWVASIYAINTSAISGKARDLLGWSNFKSVDMLSDIAVGSYAAKV